MTDVCVCMCVYARVRVPVCLSARVRVPVCLSVHVRVPAPVCLEISDRCIVREHVFLRFDDYFSCCQRAINIVEELSSAPLVGDINQPFDLPGSSLQPSFRTSRANDYLFLAITSRWLPVDLRHPQPIVPQFDLWHSVCRSSYICAGSLFLSSFAHSQAPLCTHVCLSLEADWARSLLLDIFTPRWVLADYGLLEVFSQVDEMRCSTATAVVPSGSCGSKRTCTTSQTLTVLTE